MASDLQLRLTLTHFAVTFAGMLVIGAAFTALLATRITAAHEHDLQREALSLSSQLDRALASHTSPQLLQKIIRHDGELLSKQIILLDQQGHIRYDSNHWTPFSRGAWRLSDMAMGKSGAFEGSGRLGFQLPLKVQRQTVGAVALVINPGDEGVDWGRILPYILMLFGVLAVVWLAVGAYFARSVSRPLRRLSNALQQARDGRYDHAVPEEGWSDARMLASRYNEMVAEVARAQRMQRDFMVNAAHELKTPIALVSGFATSLADGTAQRGGALTDAVGYIKEESQHLTRIVDGLFALASLDADPDGISPALCHPDAVLRQVADRFSARAQHEGKILSIDLHPDLPACLLDAHWVSSALTNLVSNALDHTLTGDSVVLRACLSEPDDSHVTSGPLILLSVEDTGCGIPAEDLPHIFERFYRGKREQRVAGHAGLGLALVREVAERHNGTVRVESVLAKGTRVTLALPCAVAPVREKVPA